jgi:N-alpha-acetyltransferase 30
MSQITDPDLKDPAASPGDNAKFWIHMQYRDERDLKLVKEMIDKELVEPYSAFTFRMFVTPWPQLCHFCHVDGEPVGVVVCKIDDHKSGRRRGYLGMIVVDKEYRKLGIGAPRHQETCSACCASGMCSSLRDNRCMRTR